MYGPAMTAMIDRGRLHRITLRFVDVELEDAFQHEEGVVGVAGYRIITGATVVLWAVAAVVLPIGTDLSTGLGIVGGGSMSLVGFVCFALSRWAVTLNRQHLLASMLTAANGVMILVLFAAGQAVEGYAVAGIMLLFAFAFVSRTQFVYAAARTVVIAGGLAVTLVVYEGRRSLIIDGFIFAAAAAGTLLALRLMEHDRRRVWHQRLVIEDQTAAIEHERAESERLLLNVLPASISIRLRSGETPIADSYRSVSVVFADIVGFTPLAAKLAPTEVIMMLSALFSHFDDLVIERRLEKIKTIGDSYMAAGGLPEPLDGHAERVIDLALAMLDCTEPHGRFAELAIRVGIHSGPAAGGVIGSQKFAYDVWGDTVNIAARLEQTGVPGRVHVSEQTRGLAQARFEFEPRGPMEMRGLGTMTTYLVVGQRPVVSSAVH
jgi:class 3 adenylate cyclase